MALNQSRMRSQLQDSAELDRLLNKIQGLLAQSSRRVVFEIAGARFNASECTNVVVDEALGSANIQFQRPGGGSVENYDKTDILMIKRLRTKKYLIIIADAANPA